MIEIGKIYRFIYKKDDNTNNIIYGLVDDISGDISIIHLNGFLGNQYKYYNVMRKGVLFNNKIISHETSNHIYKKFTIHAHYILDFVLDCYSSVV